MIKNWPTKKYQIIYADPPWCYPDWNKKQNIKNKFLGVSANIKRSPSRHYKVLPIEFIYNLPVQSIAEENSLLFLWALPYMLKEAIMTVEHWGFKYKTVVFTWIKQNKKSPSLFWGMGGWTRSNAELCLLGIKGKNKRENKSVHSVIISPVGEHSEKPNEVRERIIKLTGNCSRIELFARKKYNDWDSWGEEVTKNKGLKRCHLKRII
jgi:N6-adenosine-specific RNA methylase IME4